MMDSPIDKKTKPGHRLFCSLACFIFTVAIAASLLFYGSKDVYAADMQDYVAVGLKYGSSGVVSGNISCGEPLMLGTLDGEGTITPVFDLGTNLSVDFSYQGGKVVLGAGGTANIYEFAGEDVYIIYPASLDMSVPLKFDGGRYRGGIVLKPENGKVNVINYLLLEDYLRGVLNAEMNHQSPIEALKAQAVAARNFAVVKRNAHISQGFNLCSSTHCQVYDGVSAEYDRTDQAIRQTQGILMYSNQEVVEAYYSKNSGGYTNNCEDVWSAALGYLRAVKDPYSPDYPWTASFTTAELKSKLDAAGLGVGEIRGLQVKSRAVSGTVLELEIAGSSKTVSLKKEQIRSVLGMGVVKSLKFGFGSVPQAPSSTAELKVAGSNGKTTVTGSLCAIDKDGVKTVIDIVNMTVLGASSRYVTDGEKEETTGFADIADISGAKVTFTGSGYGHGVGMSQDGAVIMADLGKSFEEILKFYFTGVELLSR